MCGTVSLTGESKVKAPFLVAVIALSREELVPGLLLFSPTPLVIKLQLGLFLERNRIILRTGATDYGIL
jgi:hypothetical protein